MEFNVGDMVHVKKWDEAVKFRGFVPRMKPLCGKPAIITEIGEDGIYKLRPMHVEDMNLDWGWHFTEDMLEV